MFTHKTHRLFIVACLLTFVTALLGQTIPKVTPELEDSLLAVLTSNASFQDKAAACRQLGVAGSNKAIPVLVGLLSDEKLSHMARYALETLPGPAVDKALREALTNLQGKPLVGVIGSLGVRRDPQAVAPLIEFVHHTDTTVSQAALRALGSIGTREASDALRTALSHAPVQKHLGLYEGLLRCAEAQTEWGNPQAALAIYEMLRKDAAPFQVRAAALRGTILLQGADSPTLLRECLGMNDYPVFSAAVQAALELPGSKITRCLLDAVVEQSGDFQVLLATALGNRADEAALATLHGLAQQGSKPVRLAAMKSLTQIGHPATASVLVKLTQTQDREISQAAIRCLAALPPHADTAVLEMFRSPEASQRLTAVELMALRRMTGGLPTLIEAVGDSDPQVRLQALKTLGQLGTVQEVPTLLARLGQVENRDLDAMRQALTELCAQAEDPGDCVTQLIDALSRCRPPQKVVLFRVLSSLEGEAALKAVRSGVDSDNGVIHLGAIRALSQWHNTDAAPVLLTLVRTAENTRDRTLCLRGYLRIAERADLPSDERLEMCREIKPHLRQTAEKQQWLGALGQIESPRALAQIRACFTDPDVKETACTVSLALIERLVKKNNRMKQNAAVTRTLRSIVETSENTQSQDRARGLLGTS
jgi:HEAT repeat protein